MGNIVDESEIHALEFENNQLSVRLDGLQQDIFNEIGRLTYIVENSDRTSLEKSRFKITAMLLVKFLRADEDRV